MNKSNFWFWAFRFFMGKVINFVGVVFVMFFALSPSLSTFLWGEEEKSVWRARHKTRPILMTILSVNETLFFCFFLLQTFWASIFFVASLSPPVSFYFSFSQFFLSWFKDSEIHRICGRESTNASHSLKRKVISEARKDRFRFWRCAIRTREREMFFLFEIKRGRKRIS